MGVAIFALHSIVRNPRKMLTLTVGLIIATSLLTGTFLSADYMAQIILQETLNDVSFDMRVDIFPQNLSESSSIIKNLEKITEIKKIEPYIVKTLTGLNIIKNNGTSFSTIRFSQSWKIIAYGLRENISIGEINVIKGSLPLMGNSVAITDSLAKKLNLKVGDEIALLFSQLDGEEKKVNVTVSAVVRLEGKLKKTLDDPYSETSVCGWKIYRVEQEDYLIMSIGFAYSAFSAKGVRYWVFANRDTVLNPWDIDRSITNLIDIENKIEDSCQQYFHVEICDILRYALETCKGSILSLKLLAGVCILPTTFLACFLIWTSNQMFIYERRREIGLLKVKGATNKQILALIALESIIVGIVGGIIGFTVGNISCVYFLEVTVGRSIATIFPSHILVRLLVFYLLIDIIFGVAISMFFTTILVRKIIKTETNKLLQEYLEEFEKGKWRPKLVFTSFSIGLIKTVEMVLGIQLTRIITQIEAEYIVISLLLNLLYIIDIVLIFLGPLLLVYGFSKIVTHYETKFNKLFKTIVKPLLKELSDMVVKNLVRRPARTERLLFLLSLVLAYGIATITTSASAMNMTIKEIEISVGADIKAFPVQSINETQLIENISGIEGINLVSITGKTVAKIGIRNIDLFVIDENYFNVSFIKEKYLKDVSIEEVFLKFKNGENCCLISQHLSEEYMYNVGDVMQITIGTNINKTALSLNIIGIAKILPGLQQTLYDQYEKNAVVIGRKFAEKYFNLYSESSITFLIDVSEEVNATSVAEILKSQSFGIYSAFSLDEEINKSVHEVSVYLSPKFFYIQFYFAITIALTGLTIVTTSSVLERQREIALLTTRGLSKKQAIKIFTGETALIIILSFILGIVEGLSITIGFMSPVFIFKPKLPIKIIVFPSELCLMLVMGAIIAFLASIIPAWHLTQKEIAKILRIHH